MVTGTLITLAPTGAEISKSVAPGLPITLVELIAAARDAERAGASVIHVHLRDDDGLPTLELSRLVDAVAALREHTQLVVQLSTGGAVTDPEDARLRVLEAAPDAASCTMGTVNFGDAVFMNRWDFIVELHRGMRERRIVAEYEIFDVGQLETLRRLLDKHGPPYGGHVHCDLVMGVPGGMPGNLATLAAAVTALPDNATFSATGIGRASLPVMLGSLASGGHLRVGMEDTVHLAAGVPVQHNRQLVERAAQVATLAQRPPLSPEKARVLLGIADVA
jgi:uncharacterized protein (DUF849 family)